MQYSFVGHRDIKSTDWPSNPYWFIWIYWNGWKENHAWFALLSNEMVLIWCVKLLIDRVRHIFHVLPVKWNSLFCLQIMHQIQELNYKANDYSWRRRLVVFASISRTSWSSIIYYSRNIMSINTTNLFILSIIERDEIQKIEFIELFPISIRSSIESNRVASIVSARPISFIPMTWWNFQ